MADKPSIPKNWKSPADLLGRVMGNCRLTAHLSRGGMGDIYAAEHLFLGRLVAIKLPRVDTDNLDFNQKQLLAEARFLAAVTHVNIVGVYDMGLTDEGLAYLTMELLAGRSLDNIMDRTPFLSLPAIVQIAREVARALAACHRTEIICSDIKPENIMVVSGPLVGKPPRGMAWVKMIDLGAARSLADEQQREPAATVVGTPVYMSPEMALGRRMDHRSDLYSLGILLYELIAGTPPFLHEDPEKVLTMHVEREPAPLSEHRPEIQPRSAMERLVAHCLKKKPADRPESAVAFLNLLDEAAWGLPGKGRIPKTAPREPVVETRGLPNQLETVSVEPLADDAADDVAKKSQT